MGAHKSLRSSERVDEGTWERRTAYDRAREWMRAHGSVEQLTIERESG